MRQISAKVGLASLTVALAGCAAQAAKTNETSHGGDDARAKMVATIDSIVNAPIKAGKLAGASVAVVHGKDTLLLKGYGLADVELGVPTPDRGTYEIGSVTKQFTAVAIMQLVEQGKINLDDNITKYLPDYPTQGNTVTVRGLLSHTSGIKGYTELPEFQLIGMQSLPRDSLVKLFSKKPFDFKPGEQETYNNSAFFLAGLIIEKVSGMSYADYVQKNLFDKAGMKDSYYCSQSRIRKNHVHGYDTDSTGLVLKSYLDHTWPYAAGSLCSTAADLVAWNQALHKSDRLLKPESYKELIAPGTLNDGTKLRYAKGLALADVAGRRAIGHGGDIPGFASESIYLPDDDLIVIVLFNTEGPARPDAVMTKIVETVLGKAPDQSKPFDGDLAQFAGTYKGKGRGEDMKVEVVAKDGKLAIKMPGADSARSMKYFGHDTFSESGALLTFDRQGGRISRLRFDVAYGYNILNRQ